MKYIIGLLVLLGMTSACLNLSSQDLMNSSIQLNASNCIYIEDWNTTINNSINFQNNLRNITPGSNYTNYLNETYSCLFDQLNINRTLEYDEVYIDTTHNISIRAPEYPQINSLIRLEPGRSYNNRLLNLTVIANVLNQTSPSVTSLPKLNISQNLSNGQWYNNTELNISIYATPFVKLNESVTLRCAEVKNYPNFGISITGPACPTPITRTLNFGEHLIVADQGIDITAPAKLNKNIALNVGQTDIEENVGLAVSCSVNDTQLISLCSSQNDSQIVKLWERIPVNESQSCGAFSYFCINNLTQYCSNEEKYSGRYGLINCFNRNLDEVQNQTRHLTDQNNILTTQKAACENGQQQIRDDKDSSMTFILTVLGAIMILICGVILLIKWLQAQQIGNGGNLQ